MIVVSDTTPLISLLKIKQLDLLKMYFREVQIPEAVFAELTTNPRFKEEAVLIQECPYIHVIKVEDVKAIRLLQRATGLDAGESEAIILSDEIKADLLLMDELKGRQVASQMGLKIMGTIGLLMAAYEDGNITAEEIKECIFALKKYGRHISEKYYRLLLDRIEGK